MFANEEECDTAFIAGPTSALASPLPPPGHSPWYRTVFRGSGFQLKASERPHPASRTRSRAVFPPTPAIPGIERRIRGSISSLAELWRAALRLAACGGRERGKNQHICRKRELTALIGPSVYQKHFYRSCKKKKATTTTKTHRRWNHASFSPTTRTETARLAERTMT